MVGFSVFSCERWDELTGLDPSERAYLDYAGFAPVDPRVLAVMRPFLEAGIGNPSAPHSLGTEARESLDAAHAKVGRLCGGAPSGVVFTSGATEANNLAVKGTVLAARNRAGARVIVSAVEHISTMRAARALESFGATVVVAPVDEHGRVDPTRIRDAVTDDTVLISIGAACGEIGTLQPLLEIGRIARRAGVAFHVDAVGALGRVSLSVETMGIDLLSLSSNDIYGPPGAGALWVRPGMVLEPLVVGADQEAGHRSGTENVPGLVGLGVAAELIRTEGAHGESVRLAALRDRLREGLLAEIPDCRLTGSPTERLPHHLSVALPDVSSDSVLLDLDVAGIAASTGSTGGTPPRAGSHVLRAIGCTPGEAEGALCFTLGRWSTIGDVDAVLDRLPLIVSRLRSLSAIASR